jgi:phosphonate transport system substrate-binding protein
VELLAAPVLAGARYGGHPVYYSDVIVRAGSSLKTFADLSGRSWSYNDPDSHSGYNVTRYHLIQIGETRGFFGKVVAAGSHQRSIRLVADGQVDASAVDSQVLAHELLEHPELKARLRVIDALGPSPIQPVVAARTLPHDVKAAVREVLVAASGTAEGRAALALGLAEAFAPVNDRDYDRIREMLAAAERSGFVTLR